MKYKGIIFDLDGVICSTDEYHYLAWKQMADTLGIYFDREINNRLRGVSRMESLEIILERYDGPALSDERKKELTDLKNDLYRQSLKQMSPADLSDEVRETLNTLRTRGLKLAIGSSSKNALFILERLGLGSFFDAVSDGNNISRSKPDPQVFLLLRELFNCRSNNVRCPAVPVQPKAAVASCIAMPSPSYNGTPAQPQSQTMGAAATAPRLSRPSLRGKSKAGICPHMCGWPQQSRRGPIWRLGWKEIQVQFRRPAPDTPS